MPKRRARGEGTIYQRKDGLWSGQITMPDGKRQTKYNKSQKVVRDWLTEQRQNIHQGSWTSRQDKTVGEFVEEYLRDVASRNVKPQTLSGYQASFEQHIRPAIGRIKLLALRPEHVQKLYTDMSNSGLKPGTVIVTHGVLRQALNQAVKWDMIPKNPATLTKPPSRDHTPPQMFTDVDLQKFLKATAGHWIGTMVLLAVTTGLRRGELVGLEWPDVNLAEGYLKVARGVVNVNGVIQMSEPKTQRGYRTVTLPKIAVDALTEHRTRLAWAKRASVRPLVFPTRLGKIMSPDVVDTLFVKKLVELKLPRVTFHSLRHLHSTMLLVAGINPKVVQERLGHSSIAVTLGIYSHVTAGLERQAADAIEKAMGTA